VPSAKHATQNGEFLSHNQSLIDSPFPKEAWRCQKE